MVKTTLEPSQKDKVPEALIVGFNIGRTVTIVDVLIAEQPFA